MLVAHGPHTAQAQGIVYVDRSAAGADDGSSWDDAFLSLQDALRSASAGDQVWVAAGVYHPDEGSSVTPGDRSASFQIPSGVEVYGGFAGGESSRDERDIKTNETVLTGDLLDNDALVVSVDDSLRADNSYHVLEVVDAIEVILDGLTVASGNANSEAGHGGGLSIAGTAELRNISVERNSAYSGGGLATFGVEVRIVSSQFRDNVAAQFGGAAFISSGGVSIIGTTFEGNSAQLWGGAVDAENAQLLVIQSTFDRNIGSIGGGVSMNRERAFFINTVFLSNEANQGGGLMIQKARVDVVNSVFSGNRAVATTADGGEGGAIYKDASDTLRIVNSVLAFNDAENGAGGLTVSFDTALLENSIVWANTGALGEEQIENQYGQISASHSIVDGGLPPNVIDDGSNLASDPLFTNPPGVDGVFGTKDDDYHLRADSPAIDVGDSGILPIDVWDLDEDGNTREALPIDFEGRIRVHAFSGGEAIVDIGPYEAGAPLVLKIMPNPSGPSEPLLELFPKPMSGIGTLQFTAPVAARYRVQLIDILGRRIRVLSDFTAYAHKKVQIRLDVRNIPSGTYIIQIDGADVNSTAMLPIIH